jgi:hypothetical protein
VKIGLSFIFGNVEAYLPRFLESFQKLTPHLYGVRAIGGQPEDGSLGICQKYGVKTGEYINQPDAADWEHLDDFAAARNQAADMAAADGCDWILWADTDDILEEEDRTRLLELLKKRSDGVDFWLMAYALTNNGLRLPRERAWRPGKARWEDPIHENANPAAEAVVVQCMDIAITHKPDMAPKKSPPDRNLKIIDGRIPKPLEAKWAFYRAQELIGLGRKAEAVEQALAAVKMPELTVSERYELLLNLSGMSDNMATRAEYLSAAHKVDPTRREALACLTAVCLDVGKVDHALAYSRCFMALPEPKVKQWTHRGMLYGWAGNLIHYQCLRMNKMNDEADRLEREHFEKHGGLISLIHATRARPFEAAATRKLWLERAKNPDAIEHIFGIGQDDLESLAVLRRFRHAIAKDNREASSAASCYNAAAAGSSGRILVACADTMVPPVWWDEILLKNLPAETDAAHLKPLLNGELNGNGPVLRRAKYKELGFFIAPSKDAPTVGRPKISVCHATRGRPEQAIGCRQLWMAKAHDPWTVEWIFSVDEDDATAAKLKAFQPVYGKGGCVAAWNRAAEKAKGDILVQGSDDWDPPQDWDKILLDRMGDISKPAVLAISDGHRKDDLLCMAILTRARWEQQGRVMFAPEYDEASGIYSDNEYSVRAWKDGVIIKAKDVVFTHNNPLWSQTPPDDEYRRHNSKANYEKGEAIFKARNPEP